MALLGGAGIARAAPADFPGMVVNDHGNPGAVSPGCVFLAVAEKSPEIGNYLMVVNTDGSIAWSLKANNDAIYDFKVLPNGQLHYAAVTARHGWTDGGDVLHEILDENFKPRETITGGNGYVADGHDFQMLPNGNVLQVCYYLSEVDMSKIVAGGHPAALVAGTVIQELDAQRNVIFQWRTWDHFPLAGNVSGTGAVIDAFHINTLFQDADGTLIFGTPEWVKKLNRQTGEIIWHLGGPGNQFTFAGGGGPGDFGGHGMNLLPNGNYLIYDNGSDATGGTPAKAHEYSLDQVGKVATRVWTYTSAPAIQAAQGGSAQRLANGNTFIGWGIGGATTPACTEVNAAGQPVFELSFTDPLVASYRAFRFPWPPSAQTIEFTVHEIVSGNSYDFTGTGVTLDVQAGGGTVSDPYNDLTVTREPYAPLDPGFPATAPRVLPLRVKMNEFSLPDGLLTARVSFDAVSFGFKQSALPTIYYRPEVGQGIFFAQETSYNPATHKLRATLDLVSTAGDLGEFIFGYPEVAEVAYAPLLNQPESHRGIQTHDVIAPPLAEAGVVYPVNQTEPVSLSWSPKGIARWYELEIATDQTFTHPVVQEAYQTAANYVWSNPLPDTSYCYRVRTWNDAGESDWSPGSFQTVAPAIRLTAPNGFEAWRRGLKFFIQWHDNLVGNVVIDLYKGGSFLRTLATSSSAGAWLWEAAADLAPGNDYSIRVSSATDASLFAVSAAPFGIDVPFINPGSLMRLPDGRVQFRLTAPGATQAKVQGSPNLRDWEDLQTLPVTNDGADFTDPAPGLPRRFYRLSIAP